MPCDNTSIQHWPTQPPWTNNHLLLVFFFFYWGSQPYMSWSNHCILYVYEHRKWQIIVVSDSPTLYFVCVLVAMSSLSSPLSAVVSWTSGFSRKGRSVGRVVVMMRASSNHHDSINNTSTTPLHIAGSSSSKNRVKVFLNLESSFWFSSCWDCSCVFICGLVDLK